MMLLTCLFSVYVLIELRVIIEFDFPHCIDSVYDFVCFKRANYWISMYFYQTEHQKFTKPYTLSLIGPTVSSFAYREPVAPNRTPNQYSFPS